MQDPTINICKDHANILGDGFYLRQRLFVKNVSGKRKKCMQ